MNNLKDYFKNSVWDTFTANNGITVDFLIKAGIAMVMSILLGLLIYAVYKRFYAGVVFSRSFGVTLVGMTVLTCALTLAISSNVVISLGMVGALSIVRYRTAIKDPMDLLYIFWSISVGIIVAANLHVLALFIMVVMVVLVWVFASRKKSGTIYILVVHYAGEETGDRILQQFGRIRYQIKSKTFRKDDVEMTVEISARQASLTFADRIRELEGVRDLSLIQYNGEYNG